MLSWGTHFRPALPLPLPFLDFAKGRSNWSKSFPAKLNKPFC